jgi:hypothetical protein
MGEIGLGNSKSIPNSTARGAVAGSAQAAPTNTRTQSLAPSFVVPKS